MANRIIVDGPQVQTPAGGLFQTVNVVELQDQHGAFGGVEYIPDPACITGSDSGYWSAPCAPVDAASANVSVGPFTTGSTSLPSVVTISGGLLGADGYTVEYVRDGAANIPFTPNGSGQYQATLNTGYADRTVRVTDPLGSVTELEIEFPTTDGASWEDDFDLNAIGGGEKILDGIGDTIGGEPFVTYSGVECNAVGNTVQTINARAKRQLLLREQIAAEKFLWNVELLPAAEIPLPDLDSGERTIVETVALLEAEIAKRYLGVPVFHMSRTAASVYAAAVGQPISDGLVLRTALGSLIVAGAGYSGNGTPLDGDQADLGSEWIVVTGMINLYRGAVVVSDGMELEHNILATIAERAYIPVIECAILALEASIYTNNA